MIKALIDISIYIGFLLLFYFVAKTYVSVRFKRNYLRFAPLLAVGLYTVKILLLSNGSATILPHIQLAVVSVGAGSAEFSAGTTSFFALSNLYWCGVLIFTTLSVVKVFRALSYFKNATFLQKEKVWLGTSNNSQSFTFLNRIHLSNQLKNEDRSLVLEHEVLHVKFNHSLDLLLLEFCHTLFWFNPLMIIIKKQLITVHENQVDQAMYDAYQQTYVKFLVASTMGVSSSQILLTSQFYNGLSLTQRVKQMKRKIENNWAVLALIPSLALALVFVSFTTNQSVIPKMALQQTDTIYNYADVNPEYPGGMTEMTKFIQENVVYPKKEERKKIEGTTYVEFVVRKSGKISDIEIVKGVSKGIDEESKRVIGLMPLWKPGVHKGVIVDVRFTVPIKYKL